MVKPNWDAEELIENWTLLPQELELAKKKVGGNQIGFALLLKHFQLFAYFPEDKFSISQVVVSYIASQVNLQDCSYSDYDWQGRSAKVYRVEIRRLFNFKVASQDLIYVRRRYIHKDQLRSAIAEVVNATFEIRLPHIWGEGTTTCASDSKHFGAWEQNLITQYHLRYGGRGVMIYWHVEKNSTCIYSQLKTCSSSEVSAMINGVLKHCTSMEVKKNYVDSHGQSEVAFAFTHLLGFQLMPRLKRIKVQKLYRPHAGQPNAYPNLEPVMTRPINWDLIRQQYDQMVKYATALRLGTAETEAILKRFSKNPFKHTTYLALMELGRVIKTIFLCQYLDSEAIRREINEGLNVVERWNGVNEFIFYGKGGEFASNRLESQELSVLSLHLLQICLVYVNTLMIQSVLGQEHWRYKLTARDREAITPLIFGHVNPYGLFKLDMKERIERLAQPLVA